MTKKFLSFALAVIIFFSGTNFIFASDKAVFEYKNPRDIIITRPANNFQTYSDHVSLFGACDYDYPLYINEKEIDYTEHGFFSSYENLNDGENIFVLENGNHKKEVCVIKKKIEQNPDISSLDEIKLFDSKKCGIVTRDNISHRTRPDEANDDLVEPLVKNTMVNILGETKEYYFISDRTFIYKEAVDCFDGELPENQISGISFDLENKEIKFKMNINSLYKVDLNPSKVNLVIYDSSLIDNFDYQIVNNELIKDINLTENGENRSVEVLIELQDNVKTNGYKIRFEDNCLILGLKILPEKNFSDSPLHGIKVVVDAGHGGDDFGTLGPAGVKYLNEKDINLMIAKKLKESLELLGAKVLMIRDADIFVPLTERVEQIKQFMPDFSVSIHGNSRLETKNYLEASGLIVYHTFNINNAPVIIKEALAENLNFVRDTQVSNLALTRITNCPAVLIETSFLSNPYDYERLINETEQENIANSIAYAIRKYFGPQSIAMRIKK